MTEIPVSVGELFDKITVAEIMAKRVNNKTSVGRVHARLTELRRCARKFTPDPELVSQLRTVNEAIWAAHTRFKGKIAADCFDEDYMFLARSIANLHEERMTLRRDIDEAVTGTKSVDNSPSCAVLSYLV